jgi:hypothetical protein
MDHKVFQIKFERVVFELAVTLDGDVFQIALRSVALPPATACDERLLVSVPALDGMLRVVREPALEPNADNGEYIVAQRLWSRLTPENALSLVLYIAVYRPLVEGRDRSELVRRLRALVSSVLEVAGEHDACA